LPIVPNVTASGFAFAAAMTSPKFLYGLPAWVAIAIGAVPTSMTGARSFAVSNCSPGISAGIDRVRIEHEQERVAVRGRLGDLRGADRARRAGLVLDDELLLERLGELRADEPRQRVDRIRPAGTAR
jgi:hypothetical protein